MGKLIAELFNCYDHFLKLSGFLDLFATYICSILNSSNLIFNSFWREQCKQYELITYFRYNT